MRGLRKAPVAATLVVCALAAVAAACGSFEFVGIVRRRKRGSAPVPQVSAGDFTVDFA